VSFIAAGATNVTSSASTLTGDGQVTITVDATTDSCPTTPSAAERGTGASARAPHRLKHPSARPGSAHYGRLP
jgi:hypothetical protein